MKGHARILPLGTTLFGFSEAKEAIAFTQLLFFFLLIEALLEALLLIDELIIGVRANSSILYLLVQRYTFSLGPATAAEDTFEA